MRNLLMILIFAIALIGCSTKNKYIMPSVEVSSIATTNKQIGVKKIDIPSYLDSDKILVKEGDRVEDIGANFLAPPSEMLTNRAIVILKKSLNNPNVLLYPWDIKSKRGYIVEIVLNRYLYDNGYAVVEGSYYIKNAKGESIVAKNFKREEAVAKDAKSIVTTLSSLFDSIVLEIARKIAR